VISEKERFSEAFLENQLSETRALLLVYWVNPLHRHRAVEKVHFLCEKMYSFEPNRRR